ncbi:phospholipase [Chitinophaga caeni]|uniref:Phospholipase n=1 Tax=Chitinophaga caeni TaxID=2029983 RepID=A0A291QTK5_9BACT|nr:phospholipase [Chitinophaga caeni]ATL47267.1 phospholipase [Chitinophaga caeni]
MKLVDTMIRYAIALCIALIYIVPSYANSNFHTGVPQDETGLKVPTGFSVHKIRKAGPYVEEYLLFLPANYNDRKMRNYHWPVIFFLHGKGERGEDINKVRDMGLPHMLKHRQQFPFIMIAPLAKSAINYWDINSLNILYEEIISLYKVDLSRIYLTGLSMGGHGTWTWGMDSPGKFAAIVPICGYGKTGNACALATMPIWAFHNEDDDTVPVRATRQLVQAVRDCGNKKVLYTESARGGHNAWGKAYYESDLFTWLLKQHK